MIKFYDSNIVNILPASLAEKEKTQALGYALQKATQRLLEHCSYISVYAAISKSFILCVFSTFIMVADNFITVFLSTLSTLSTFYCGNLSQQNTLFSFEKGCAIIQLFQSAVVLTAYNRNFLRK